MLANRSFLLFAAAMIGSYVLSFQVYLALPLHAADLAPQHQALLIAAMFVVSGVVAVAAQLRITRWFSSRWGTEPLPGHRHDRGGTVLHPADPVARHPVRDTCWRSRRCC